MAKRSASSPKTKQAGQPGSSRQLAQSMVAPKVTILLPRSADPPGSPSLTVEVQRG